MSVAVQIQTRPARRRRRLVEFRDPFVVLDGVEPLRGPRPLAFGLQLLDARHHLLPVAEDDVEPIGGRRDDAGRRSLAGRRLPGGLGVEQKDAGQRQHEGHGDEARNRPHGVTP